MEISIDRNYDLCLSFLTSIRGTYPVQFKIKTKIKGVDLKHIQVKLHCYHMFVMYFWSFTEPKMKNIPGSSNEWYNDSNDLYYFMQVLIQFSPDSSYQWLIKKGRNSLCPSVHVQETWGLDWRIPFPYTDWFSIHFTSVKVFLVDLFWSVIFIFCVACVCFCFFWLHHAFDARSTPGIHDMVPMPGGSRRQFNESFHQ